MKNLNEIAILEETNNEIRKEIYSIQDTIRLGVQEYLQIEFDPFKELTIVVNRGSATFRMKNEEGINRDVFDLYWYERYNKATTLELSYYTTTCSSEYEFNRLIFLGKIARIVKERRESILSSISSINKKYEGRLEELYSFIHANEKKIVEYQIEDINNKKEEIKKDLLSKGVEFSVPREIRFKFNRFSEVKKLRIENISASGKTGRVVYMDEWNYSRVEEKVSVEKVIDQVTSLHKFITELEIA